MRWSSVMPAKTCWAQLAGDGEAEAVEGVVAGLGVAAAVGDPRSLTEVVPQELRTEAMRSRRIRQSGIRQIITQTWAASRSLLAGVLGPIERWRPAHI